MNDRNIPVTEDELHAYVDGELPVERRADVEAWLAAHPDEAERVQSWRAMAEMLHARYDAVAQEPVPARLELERLERRPHGSIQRSAQGGLVQARERYQGIGEERDVLRGVQIEPSSRRAGDVVRDDGPHHARAPSSECGRRSS